MRPCPRHGAWSWSWGSTAAALLLANCAVLTAVAYQEDGAEQRAWAWPPTRRHTQGTQGVTIDPCSFTYRDASIGESDVQRAIDLYTPLMFSGHICSGAASDAPSRRATAALSSIEIQVEEPRLMNLSLNLLESYLLEIPGPNGTGTITLKTQTYVGVLRGLETLSQLILRTGLSADG